MRNSRRNWATLSMEVGPGAGGAALGVGVGNPLQPAGTPGWSRSPMDSPTAARAGGEFPKELCCGDRIHTKAGKKRQERGQ